MKTTGSWDPYADFQRHVLSNGLSVYHSRWDRQWLKVGFVVHSGSFADVEGKEGTAHFVEHMVSKNIKGASRKEAELFFRRMGGDAMFGSTGPFSTSYWFVIPAKAEVLQKALEIFGDMLIGGNNFERYLERERNVILCEFGSRFPFGFMYELYELHKRRVLYDGLTMQFYKGNLGDKETIPLITKKDLMQFYATNYVPQNMSVVVVGDLRGEELLKFLNGSAFSKKIKGVRNPLPEKCSVAPKPKESEHVLNISELVSSTPANIASYESFVAMPGAYNLKMLELFKVMLSHVLDDEIRQRFGATYNFGVSMADYIQVREMRIGGRISPSIMENIGEIIRSGLLHLKKKRSLFRNLRIAKLNRYLLLDINGHILIKNVMDDLEIYHRIISLREEIELIEAVSFGELCDLADYVADASNRWTLIENPD